MQLRCFYYNYSLLVYLYIPIGYSLLFGHRVACGVFVKSSNDKIKKRQSSQCLIFSPAIPAEAHRVWISTHLWHTNFTRTKVVPYGAYKNGIETGTIPRGVVMITHRNIVFRFKFFDFYKKLAEFCYQSRIFYRNTKVMWVTITTQRGVVQVSFPFL